MLHNWCEAIPLALSCIADSCACAALQVDLLPEITQSPRFLPEADNLLPKGLK